MTIVEQIARIAGTLPESLAREALDFVRFLQALNLERNATAA